MSECRPFSMFNVRLLLRVRLDFLSVPLLVGRTANELAVWIRPDPLEASIRIVCEFILGHSSRRCKIQLSCSQWERKPIKDRVLLLMGVWLASAHNTRSQAWQLVRFGLLGAPPARLSNVSRFQARSAHIRDHLKQTREIQQVHGRFRTWLQLLFVPQATQVERLRSHVDNKRVH